MTSSECRLGTMPHYDISDTNLGAKPYLTMTHVITQTECCIDYNVKTVTRAHINSFLPPYITHCWQPKQLHVDPAS